MDLQGGPTFEDLSIDDELTQLQRLVRYSSSSIALQRLVHVKVGPKEPCENGSSWGVILSREAVGRREPRSRPALPLAESSQGGQPRKFGIEY